MEPRRSHPALAKGRGWPYSSIGKCMTRGSGKRKPVQIRRGPATVTGVDVNSTMPLGDREGELTARSQETP